MQYASGTKRTDLQVDVRYKRKADIFTESYRKPFLAPAWLYLAVSVTNTSVISLQLTARYSSSFLENALTVADALFCGHRDRPA